MEFLSGAKLAVFLNVGLASLPFILPNKFVKQTFAGIGKFLSFFFRQKLGRGGGEKVESYFQGTLQAAMDGLNEGLDSDDQKS
jgi:hypothetical protein